MDDLCFVYLYFYNQMEEEPRQPTAVETSSTSIPTVPMELEATEPAMDTTDLIDHKRKGPESRTVVIGSESKNQRTEALVLATLSNCDLNVEDYVRQYSWMASRGRKHKTGFPNQLVTACNMPIFSLLDAYMNKCLYTTLPVEPPVVGKTLVSLPGSVYSSFLVNLQDGCSFKVDTDTDNITEDEIYPIWDQVEEADKKEADCALEVASILIVNTLPRGARQLRGCPSASCSLLRRPTRWTVNPSMSPGPS